mgnify:CR=1 FL=1
MSKRLLKIIVKLVYFTPTKADCDESVRRKYVVELNYSSGCETMNVLNIWLGKEKFTLEHGNFTSLKSI